MYRGKYSNLIKEIIKESFIKDYSGTPIVYYTSSESEAKQMISTLLTKNPVRGIYDLKHKIYIFGDAYNVIHADLIEKMKLYGKEHLSYPIVDKEIYEYLDKNCAMFKVIDETDYKSFSRSDGYKYAFIGKLDDNQYVIFRNNELAPSYYNAPDELKKMQQVPLFKNIQFKKYDIRGVGLNTKDQLPQRMVDNPSNIMEDYDYIDDIEVLLNPTKKEFNDLVKRNKWYRILLSNTGIAIWSADTPLLHMYVEDEYDVKNATHLFAYNGNVYFQDYNLIPEDFDNDMKEWFIKQAKELDNNKILRTYFPRMNMEQSVIKMFNGENVIVEAKHRKKLNLPDNSENQVINKVINAIRNNRWDTGEIINNYILFTELAYSHYLDAIIDEMENNKIHLKNTYEKIYNQAINYIYKNMNNQNSLAFKITDDIYRNSAEHILQNIKNELIDNNIYREIDTKLSINELLQHLKEYGTGNCWAKQYDKAESYNSDYNGTSYIFVGQATDKNISWYDSILLRMVNEDENEIRLRNNAPIRITKIINKDTKKRYNVNQVFSTGDKYNYPISFNESKQNINENKLSEVQEDIKYILSSDTVLFSCDPSTYDFMLKCLKQGQKPEYFYFNFYKNRPTFMNLCRSLLYRFTGNKIKGTDELIKKKISSYDGYSISKEAIKVILNGYYGKIKVGI